MKKLLTFILSLLLFVSVTIPASATDTHTISIDEVEHKLNIILNKSTYYVIEEHTLLKASDGTPKYLFIGLKPYGYAIYNLQTDMFEEILHQSVELPYQFDTQYDCYYWGPNNYFYFNGNSFMHTKSNSILDDRTYANLIALEEQKELVTASMSTGYTTYSDTATYSVSTVWRSYQITNYDYFESLLGGDFGTNNGFSCTAVASAILLGYYDYYVSDYYVPTQFESGCGTNEAFHQFLYDSMNSDDYLRGVSIGEARDAINDGFGALRINAAAYTIAANHESVFDIVETKIAANRPVVAAMFESYNADCPLNHSVVVYGYRELVDVGTDNVNERYYYVHTGWHSQELAVNNYAWFADALYINR